MNPQTAAQLLYLAGIVFAVLLYVCAISALLRLPGYLYRQQKRSQEIIDLLRSIDRKTLRQPTDDEKFREFLGKK